MKNRNSVIGWILVACLILPGNSASGMDWLKSKIGGKKETPSKPSSQGPHDTPSRPPSHGASDTSSRAPSQGAPPQRGSSQSRMAPTPPRPLVFYDPHFPLAQQIAQMEADQANQYRELGAITQRLPTDWLQAQRGTGPQLISFSRIHATYAQITKPQQEALKILEQAAAFENTNILPRQELLDQKRAELVQKAAEALAAAQQKAREDEEGTEAQARVIIQNEVGAAYAQLMADAVTAHQRALEAERERQGKEARLALESEAIQAWTALQGDEQTAYVQLIEPAAESRRLAQQAETRAFLAHSVGWLGGVPDDRLPPSIRAQKLTSAIVNRDSYYVLNAPSDDYKWVRTQIVRDNKDHQMLFDLAVVHRAGNFKDGHADNTFIIKAREMGADALPAAVKLVRRCTDTLKAGVPQDGLSASISDMMTDTIVTGGRIGLNLRRQATEAEMAVIIPALRQRGERAFAQAANNVENALNELARIFLDAAFRREKGATSARVVDYDKSLFDSHKAHCFIAATRGLQDGEVENLIESTYGKKLGMAKAQILATRKYYDRFDQ